MDIGQIYHFLFETYAGVGCLVAAALVISLLLAFLLERRTRRIFKDRPAPDDSDLFESVDDGDEGDA